MVEARPQSHSVMNSLTSSTSWYKKTASLSLSYTMLACKPGSWQTDSAKFLRIHSLNCSFTALPGALP